MRAVPRIVATVALVAVAAGCTADPVPPSPSTAPPVAVVRDATALGGCPGPTARLAPDLVVASTALPAGAGCTWTDPSSTAVVRADVHAAGGLGALYRAAGEFRAFRTGQLAGAPTVVTTPGGDPSCSLHAGLSDGELLVVQVGPATAPVPDPCRTAAAVAERLLTAMPTRSTR
ncbi:DUF3558 family protein [Pseudonocardia endophytica]|uniref:Uncharacterized protein DUF3558 n=1 Tax=Pseudonocardia endophytica TaxID=401976 RepID=A0A4R1I117_PSEEN|nr:DUF3558 family protein [Pseudonocardia endophytica]TCK26119.1 uncharacterized protein DUF3558 [Pseudonocardia endophytica]